MGWNQHLAGRRDVQSRQFGHKRETYTKLLELIFKIMKRDFISQKVRASKANRRDVDQMLAFKRDLLIWGSPEMIKMWLEVEANEEAPPAGVASRFDKLLRSMRSDLGHDDSDLAEGELFGLLLTSDARKELTPD